MTILAQIVNLVNVNASAPTRADEIADAAAEVFQRYGLRKASMDDLATAAGLSRQGLYLHYRTKEELFHASLHRILRRQTEKVTEALALDGRNLPDRLTAALEVLHREYATVYHGTTAELIEAAETLGRSLLDETIEHNTRELATALIHAGITDRWQGVAVTGEQLASLLLTAVAGSAQLYPGSGDYQDRVRTVITVVLAGGGSQ